MPKNYYKYGKIITEFHCTQYVQILAVLCIVYIQTTTLISSLFDLISSNLITVNQQRYVIMMFTLEVGWECQFF